MSRWVRLLDGVLMAYRDPENHKKWCRNDYVENRGKYAAKRDARRLAIRKYLSERKTSCSVCGYSQCKAALEFHHVNADDKTVTPANMVSKGWSFSRIDRELCKCIVVCSNCHREIHSLEGGLIGRAAGSEPEG